VAGNLQVFYNQLRKGLVEAQFQQSEKLLEEQIAHLMMVREAWVEVQRVHSAPVVAPPQPASSDTPTPASDWSA
jgi:flagellin-specific chaperone FliS